MKYISQNVISSYTASDYQTPRIEVVDRQIWLASFNFTTVSKGTNETPMSLKQYLNVLGENENRTHFFARNIILKLLIYCKTIYRGQTSNRNVHLYMKLVRFIQTILSSIACAVDFLTTPCITDFRFPKLSKLFHKYFLGLSECIIWS